MNLTELADDLQQLIDQLQMKLNEMRMFDRSSNLTNLDMLLTRKETAAFIGKSERQLDRLCENNRIHRETVDGQIRIRKSELIRYQGLDVESHV